MISGRLEPPRQTQKRPRREAEYSVGTWASAGTGGVPGWTGGVVRDPLEWQVFAKGTWVLNL